MRVLLVDDQPTIRKGLRLRLSTEEDIAVVGEAGDGPTAIDLAASLVPDVIILDVSMPNMDGFETALRLRDVTASAIVMLSLHDDANTRERAADVGADAFVSKCEPDGLLIDAIRRLGTGIRDPGRFPNPGA